ADTFTSSDGKLFGVISGSAWSPIEFREGDVASPLRILTGIGGNTVDVHRTSNFLFELAIVSHRPDTVNIGYNGHMRRIQGAVDVTNPPSFTTLNLLDYADRSGHTVSITNQYTSISGLARITYKQADLKALTLLGSQGTSTYKIASIPNHNAPN